MVTLDKIVDKARKEGRTLLTEIEAKEMLKQAGIDVVETRLAANEDEAVSMSREFGFPVVLKIASPDVVHKSDAGGVKLGLKTSNQVAKAYEDIMKSIREKYPKAKIQGASVQKMARPGVEVIIGMSKDAQFGPVIMFGLGGVFVEILKDVAFRIVPLERRDAHEMIQEIKGRPLLEGYRGSDPVDIANLEELILKVSGFVEQHPEIKELDLNPVFAYKDGAVAVDARIILEAELPRAEARGLA
ncbi:MAG: acetyl-CoA synthetase [Chloroflexi bacterium RBG_16_57_8]|nr:MAG: acetyl-CoA synthetase [Chloroflexi bacterium RBG_16_57_8]